ncbi:MAG: hypothetical protein BZY87_03555 [SAR202 cluster bacterium Io17-Chloro-G6]|nr:MAG: hypothetical protein BZY87_03555 [SAR202 cluster bacterium Io17-Chloro-G6]
MTLCDQAIQQLNAYFTDDMECLGVDSGYEVVRTPFMYPDRDHIELFIREIGDDQILVSDLGQTVLKLSEYGFILRNSPRRRAMVFQITSSLGVRFENGSLLVTSSLDEAGTRMWQLVMALQRLADLVFTVGSYVRATFGDQFENFVAERGIRYRRGVQIELPTSYRFTADFTVNGGKVVQLLAAGSIGYARERANKVYVDFSEMAIAADRRIRVAVIDDSQSWWSEDAQFPLGHQTDRVLYWGNKSELERVLLQEASI